MIFKSPIEFDETASRLKLINQWKCFGCCHVRTMTIIVGLWHLAIHIMGFFLFVVAHYIVPNYYCDSLSFTNLPYSSATSDPQITRIKKNFDSSTTSDLKSVINASGSTIWVAMSLLSLVSTLLLICGAMRKKSLLLLPFFFLQLFDILFDVSIIGVYVAVSSSVSEFFGELYNAPFQQFLLHFGFYQKIIFTCVYILLALFIKVYLICVVYFCYRYLTNCWKYSHDNGTTLQISESTANVIK